jgi:exodeoxyribonuclease VII small subunit
MTDTTREPREPSQPGGGLGAQPPANESLSPQIGGEGTNPNDGFGADMERLEAIVARLEGDESLGLEEALALYQQGVALAGECRRRLVGAQLTMTELPVRPSAEAGPQDAPPEDAPLEDTPPEDGPDGPEAGR